MTYALTPTGTVRSEYTIVRKDIDEYYLISSGALTEYDQDYLIKNARDKQEEFGFIEIQDVTSQFGAFAVAGPKSRELLEKIVNAINPKEIFSNQNFPWLSSQEIELGMVPALAIRVAYTGELGWEIHHPVEFQNNLLGSLLDAGSDLNLKLVGARAQNWLRQEKGYRAFGNELGRDASLIEAGLSKFIDMEKDFLGKEALAKRESNVACVTLLVDGPDDCDPWGREAVFKSGRKIGRLTSGGYSTVYRKSIAMGYIENNFCKIGQKVEVKIMNKLWPAMVSEDSPHDPKNLKILNK